jgi:hypothetical protein
MLFQALVVLIVVTLFQHSLEFNLRNAPVRNFGLRESNLVELMTDKFVASERGRKEGIHQLAKQFVIENKIQRRNSKNFHVSNDTSINGAEQIEFETNKESEISKEQLDLILKEQSISFEDLKSMQRAILGGDLPRCKHPSRKRFGKATSKAV